MYLLVKPKSYINIFLISYDPFPITRIPQTKYNNMKPKWLKVMIPTLGLKNKYKKKYAAIGGIF
jgi:hypothetical protein